MSLISESILKRKNIPAIVIIVVLLAVVGGIALAAQDNHAYRRVAFGFHDKTGQLPPHSRGKRVHARFVVDDNCRSRAGAKKPQGRGLNV